MKIKTSVTLSKQALRAIDRFAGRGGNRSRVIEAAVLEFAAVRERSARDARDRTRIDRLANELNRGVLDVLEYQADL